MKLMMTVKWMVVMGIVLIASQVIAEEVVSLKTPKDKVNYSIGVSTIRNFKQYRSGSDIDLDKVIKGMKDELAGEKLLISEKELRAALTAVQAEIMQKKRTDRVLATMPSATPPPGPGAKP
jgi:FKBP-type peptidyl-prolyl cis-trans isomerase